MLIQPYNPHWPHDFQSLAEVLRQSLVKLHVQIEHVGSTAVPGLAAKPIIDIDIWFELNQSFAEIKAALVGLGYVHAGDQGIPDREVFKRASILHHAVLDKIQHHLYVCPATSRELRRHLVFRDALRRSPELRDLYQQLKYTIAEKANQSKKLYAALKEKEARGFIDDVLGQYSL